MHIKVKRSKKDWDQCSPLNTRKRPSPSGHMALLYHVKVSTHYSTQSRRIWLMALSIKTECVKLSFCHQKGVGIEKLERLAKQCMQFIHWQSGMRVGSQIHGKWIEVRLREKKMMMIMMRGVGPRGVAT
jgi:hypothetical protein